MALRELSLTLCRQATKSPRSAISIAARHSRRYASGEAAAPQDAVVDQDLEPESSFSTSDYPKEKIEEFDPVKTAQGRQRQLPPSRYDANGCHNSSSRPQLILQDTNIDLLDSIEDHFIRTNLHHHPILRPGSSFPAPSPERASKRPTSLPSLPTS
jgi:hypothetical protein